MKSRLYVIEVSKFKKGHGAFLNLSSSGRMDYDTTTRELSINEYSYQNKMDTLFFFQILLISILILCIFAYGVTAGFFSNAMFIYIGLLLVIIDGVIFMARYAYTANMRDPNHWFRRRFAMVGATPPAAEVQASTNFGAYGLPDISGVDISGICMTAGYKLA